MIRVRFATLADEPVLIEFLRAHWSDSHLFVHRPEVFRWQHVPPGGGDRLNMVVAMEERDGGGAPSSEVLGVLGFIPTGRFDHALGDRDLALAIWKVRTEAVPPGLGLRLLKFLQAELTPRTIAAIGISDIVKPIYRLLRYEVGELHHSALFNPSLDAADVRLAAGVPAAAFDVPGAAESMIDLTPLSAEDVAAVDAFAAVQVPSKSWTYVRQRYVEHPWYRYTVKLVRQNGKPVATVVWRQVSAAGASALRIVDIIGSVDWLRHARTALAAEVVDAGAEYVDLMQWGIDPELIEAAGFVSTTAHDTLQLPNHFSPFEARNVVVDIAVLSDADPERVRLFRADSDQDRPNQVADLAPGNE